MDEQQQVEDIVKCSDCGSRSLTRDETRGEVVCDDCGLVLEDNVIDQGAEWRVFSPEQGDQRARTGAPMTVHAPRQRIVNRYRLAKQRLLWKNN
jgi:transcription initiation factor TFIIB